MLGVGVRYSRGWVGWGSWGVWRLALRLRAMVGLKIAEVVMGA
jgi:hypothetical protein